MTERERLLDLIDYVQNGKQDIPFGGGAFRKELADYLLENGVIVPPCKVGDVVYVIPSKANRGINVINGFAHLNRVYEQKISKVEIFANNKYMLSTCDGLQSVHCDLYKETWFLTKEEAEQALKGGAE